MADFRNRPHDNYIFNAEWKALYKLTEHWQSNLKFYKDNLFFLQRLISKYLSWISKKENIEVVKKIEANLINLDKQCSLLQKKTTKHLKFLAELIDDKSKYDSQQFREEHETLENDISSFVKLFRILKKELFKATEKIMSTEMLVDQKISKK